jgi:hypothetical protein
MNYTIIVKGFRNKSARMVVARQLSRVAGITLEEALSQTEHLPITLFRSVGSETVGSTIDRYRRLGIDVQAIEAMPRTASAGGNDETFMPPADTPRSRGGAHCHKTADRSDGNRQRIGIPPVQPHTTPREARLPMSLRNRVILGGSILFAAAAVYAIFSLSQPSAPDEEDAAVLRDSTGRAEKKVRNSSGTPAACNVTPAARERAKQLVDSAQTLGNGAERAIRFYTMAIAFNKYNCNAWFGLLDAYQQCGRTSDVEATRQAMRDLFGERGISIESIIRPFGDLAEIRSENGALTIEYRTKGPLVREKLIHETFLIYRAIRSDCDCSTLSIFAFRDGSNGLVVHLGARKELLSVAEFEQKATIRFFDAPAGKKTRAPTR